MYLNKSFVLTKQKKFITRTYRRDISFRKELTVSVNSHKTFWVSHTILAVARGMQALFYRSSGS